MFTLLRIYTNHFQLCDGGYCIILPILITAMAAVTVTQPEMSIKQATDTITNSVSLIELQGHTELHLLIQGYACNRRRKYLKMHVCGHFWCIKTWQWCGCHSLSHMHWEEISAVASTLGIMCHTLGNDSDIKQKTWKLQNISHHWRKVLYHLHHVQFNIKIWLVCWLVYQETFYMMCLLL